MYTTTTRIILATLGFCFAWIAYEFELVILALIMLSSALLQIWGYFKNGTVYLAFRQLKRKQFSKAEMTLHETKYPNLLSKKQKSYFHFAKGLLEHNKRNFDICYDQLKLALTLGLRTENDSAIATLHLADIELERKNFDEARKFLESLKTFKYKPELEPEIEKVNEELAKQDANRTI